jgi:hypothetical protein
VSLGHFDRVTEQHAGTATKPREKATTRSDDALSLDRRRRIVF